MSSNTIGFTADASKKYDKHDASIFKYVEPDDLLRFGLIPELVGRLPVIAALDNLSVEAMHNILLEPKNALLKQYQKLFAMDGIELHFDTAAIDSVVEKARALGTGARGLRAVLEDTMLDIMFDIHSMTDVASCRITRDTVIHGAEPVFEPHKASA